VQLFIFAFSTWLFWQFAAAIRRFLCFFTTRSRKKGNIFVTENAVAQLIF